MKRTLLSLPLSSSSLGQKLLFRLLGDSGESIVSLIFESLSSYYPSSEAKLASSGLMDVILHIGVLAEEHSISTSACTDSLKSLASELADACLRDSPDEEEAKLVSCHIQTLYSRIRQMLENHVSADKMSTFSDAFDLLSVVGYLYSLISGSSASELGGLLAVALNRASLLKHQREAERDALGPSADEKKALFESRKAHSPSYDEFTLDPVKKRYWLEYCHRVGLMYLIGFIQQVEDYRSTGNKVLRGKKADRICSKYLGGGGGVVFVESVVVDVRSGQYRPGLFDECVLAADRHLRAAFVSGFVSSVEYSSWVSGEHL